MSDISVRFYFNLLRFAAAYTFGNFSIRNTSADDLLVDSLMHSASTADSEIHRLFLYCNAIKQEIR